MSHNTHHPAHSPLSVEGAQRLLDLAPEGHIGYGSLVEVVDASVHGRMWEGDPEGYRFVTRGFNNFMQVTIREMSAQMGVQPTTTPDMSSVAASRDFILRIQGNGERVAPEPQYRPWLQYQNKRADEYNPDTPQTPDILPDYLRFGTSKDLDGELDSRLVGTLRLYVDAHPRYIPELTAQICKAFIRLRGHMPHGKFREAATSQRDLDRHDGLIFFINNPEDLTALAAITTYAAQRWPHITAGRAGIVMGEPISVNGIEFPAIRLAQSPGNGNSFSEDQQVFVKRALAETFADSQRPDTTLFIGALSRHAAQAGWNPDRPSFIAAQDTSVIDAALRVAGDDVSRWIASDRKAA